MVTVARASSGEVAHGMAGIQLTAFTQGFLAGLAAGEQIAHMPAGPSRETAVLKALATAYGGPGTRRLRDGIRRHLAALDAARGTS